jgi:ATP-dependent Clp protease ATP-binding subunit ClpC
MGVMFERFTVPARRVVVVAQEEARLLGHSHIGTGHVLLGLLQVDDLAGHLLAGRGLGYEDARTKVEAAGGPGNGSPSGHIPFTPGAKKALEMSLREALQLGDNFIGTEHLLLGLLREGEGPGAEILHRQGLELDDVRRAVSLVDRSVRRGDLGDGEEPEMVSVRAEEFARLVDEVARLRDLLREHGIDPGEELPGFGQE